jgi:hypothetical protein
MADLPAPTEPDGSPRALVTELSELVGAETAAGWCGDLLAGADPHEYVDVLSYLGSNCRAAAFDSRWHDYWYRTWGARGLLYVWADSATAPVVVGLSDEHWRPAEMCLKVAARREICEAGPGAVPLATHELARVRAAAVRCLSKVGDAEHVDTVEAARADPDALVRRTAHRAMLEMVERLELEHSR